MINVASYRRMDNQFDVLGNTTWGIRKVLMTFSFVNKLALRMFSNGVKGCLDVPARVRALDPQIRGG